MSSNKLQPKRVTGFVYGEGSFVITILKTKDRKLRWTVKHIFARGLHIKNLPLLEEIKAFFGGR